MRITSIVDRGMLALSLLQLGVYRSMMGLEEARVGVVGYLEHWIREQLRKSVFYCFPRYFNYTLS